MALDDLRNPAMTVALRLEDRNHIAQRIINDMQTSTQEWTLELGS